MDSLVEASSGQGDLREVGLDIRYQKWAGVKPISLGKLAIVVRVREKPPHPI